MAKAIDVTGKTPERAWLRFEHTGKLSPDVQSDITLHHGDGVFWELTEAARAAKLKEFTEAANSDSITIGQLRKLARDLGKLRDTQHYEAVKLQWQRFAIMPRIVPDAELSVHRRKAELEDVIKVKSDELISRGVLMGLPGGDSDVGRHQLRVKLLANDFDVIAAKGRLTIAEDELATAKVNSLTPPSVKYLDRTVPQTGAELADLILRQELSPIGEPVLTEPAKTLRGVLGLNNAPLLAEHVDTLHGIQNAIGVADAGNGYNVGNFRRLTAAKGERVAELMAELPATESRNRAVQVCRESNRDERHSGGSKPRTTYIDDEPNQIAESVAS